MGRPLRLDWWEGDSAQALWRAYRAEPERHLRARLHALWQMRPGRSARAAAAVVGVHDVNVQQWVACRRW